MFTVIKGSFVPGAGRPDGDSIRFRPDNADPIFRLRRRGHAPRISSTTGTIQLRFEGIDTMESKATDPFSSDATLSNLELCGVGNGQEFGRGYILSNQLGPNGRPIAFVFSGETDKIDGSEVFLDITWMEESVNFKQIVRGHAYPLFYDTLYKELREHIATATVGARNSRNGVWSADITNSGAQYTGEESVLTMAPIFPKLWRRLDKYSRDTDIVDPTSLAEFLNYLEDGDERIFVVTQQWNTSFDSIVEVDEDQIKLIVLPEEIVVTSV